MKKFFCLVMICLFSLGTVTWAADEEPINISCTTQNNFTQYIKLLNKNKDSVLKIMPHLGMNSEGVNPNDSCLGVAVYFQKDNDQEIAKRITIKNPLVAFKDAKIGDSIDKFQDDFNKVIDRDELIAYRSFAYQDKALTAFYSPSDKKVQAVIITEDSSKKKRPEFKLFDEEINGVYFGKNLEYILSETRKNDAIERAIRKNYPAISATDKVNYYYNYVDLNDDGTMEIVVYLQMSSGHGPISNSALVLSPDNGQYTLLGKFGVASNPIIISETKTNGWHDIVMGLPTRDGELVFFAAKFGEKEYHSNTSIQARLLEEVVFGKAVIADNTVVRTGIKL